MSMGYVDHPLFEQPENPEAPIWRYVDFTEFAALLTSQSLYFSRADRLGDAFEGSYPCCAVDLWAQPQIGDGLRFYEEFRTGDRLDRP